MKSDFVTCSGCGWPYASGECALEEQHGKLKEDQHVSDDNWGDAESIAKASN